MQKEWLNWKSATLPSISGCISEEEKEDFIQVTLLFLGVCKEGLQALGYNVTADALNETFAEINSEELIERALARASEQVGGAQCSEIALARLFGKSVLHQATQIAVRVLSSTVPAVPPYVSVRTMDMTCKVIENVVRRLGTETVLNDPRLISHLESLFVKWTRESKPETYTRPICHALHVIREITQERKATAA